MIPNDFGVCVYSLGKEPGTLVARWLKPGLGQPYSGTEKAEVSDGFVGDFDITYCGEDSMPSASFLLRISRDKDVHHLSWYLEGVLHSSGVGFIHGNDLVIGYRKYSITL